VAKKKTLKQWADYHYNQFKKDFRYSSYKDDALRTLAYDQAKISFAKENPPGIASTSFNATNTETPRVGPGATSAPVPPSGVKKRPDVLPTPAPTATVAQTPPGGMTYNERIQGRIAATGTAGGGPFTYTSPTGATGTGYDMPTFLRGLETPDYIQLQAALKRLGYSAKNKEEVNQILEQVFPQYFPVTDLKTLLGKLKEQELPGAGEEPNLPDRRIGQVDRGTLVQVAQAVAAKGMFELTEEELNQIIAPWEKKLKQGTVTTTKKVRNPKTGKLENVTETKSAFRQGEEELALAERLKAQRPEQYQLAEGINFVDELKKLLSGGM
jgi:peptidoglycan hydrolase-like protein with peptidoglycan-binding domain